MERRQSNSPFTVDQEKFIVEKYSVFKNSKAVKNAFIKEYKNSENSRKLWELQARAFKRVFERFQQYGIAAVNASNSNPKHSMHKRDVDRSDWEKIGIIQNFLLNFRWHRYIMDRLN